MTMSRRLFMAGCAAGFAGSLGMACEGYQPWSSFQYKFKNAVETQNTARNLIFILLDGAPSHVDTFDLKTGPWTPDALGASYIAPGYEWPVGLMPKLAERYQMFSLVRSLTAVEAVHERAVYHLLTAHRLNAGTRSEVPHLASVLSYKLASQRQPHHSLPTVVIFGPTIVGKGFLPSEHVGINLDESGAIPNLNHEFLGQTDRFGLLSQLLAHDKPRGAQQDQAVFRGQAQVMMADRDLIDLAPIPVSNNSNLFSDFFVQQCETTVNFIEADKGARVFQLTLGNWDHHSEIYQNQTLLGLGQALDNGVAHLLDRLSSVPAQHGPGSLLDETLIVAVGEFGRTVGPLNTSNGRDHFPNAMSALIAGGGVTGGRIIGRTGRNGGVITDPGWSHNRFMTINDLAATIYSAMGVDWTERVSDTPSGRVFELLDSNIAGPLYPIDPLFV